MDVVHGRVINHLVVYNDKKGKKKLGEIQGYEEFTEYEC